MIPTPVGIEKEKFTVTDPTGRKLIIYKITTIMKQEYLDGGSITFDGDKRFQLADGSPVNYFPDSDEYEIASTGKRMKREG